jgi:hypothetical protein
MFVYMKRCYKENGNVVCVCWLLLYLGVSRAQRGTVLCGLPLPVHWRCTSLRGGADHCRGALKRSVLRHGRCCSRRCICIRRCSLAMVLAVEQEA